MSSRRQPKKPTKERLAQAALFYLGRYAASEESLRRVLTNKLRRYALTDEGFAADGAAQSDLKQEIERLIAHYRATGVLNDAAYAEMKVASLRRAGSSARRITQKLAHKGVKGALVEAALQGQEEEEGEGAELRAARAFARRRGLGPYRKTSKGLEARAQAVKDSATLARAGFTWDTVRVVLGEVEEEEDLF